MAYQKSRFDKKKERKEREKKRKVEKGFEKNFYLRELEQPFTFHS